MASIFTGKQNNFSKIKGLGNKLHYNCVSNKVPCMKIVFYKNTTE